MPFRPLNDSHALQEVAFALILGRSLDRAEIEAVTSAHNRWQKELPKIAPIFEQQVTFAGLETQSALANLPGLPIPPGLQLPSMAGSVALKGVVFDAIKRDGSLDWRLRADGEMLGVNCLSYTRWHDVWANARNLLSQACSIVMKPNLPVAGAALQCIDVFLWEGDSAEYRADQLFRMDADYFPRSIRDHGPLWHMHQGWFRHEGLPFAGRRLEKIHIDAVEGTFGGAKGYSVKIDITLRYDLETPLNSYAALFEGERAFIDIVFNDMHEQNKRFVSEILTEDVQRRIGLHG